MIPLGALQIFVVEPGDPRLENMQGFRSGRYYVTAELFDEIKKDPHCFPYDWKETGKIIDGELTAPLLSAPKTGGESS